MSRALIVTFLLLAPGCLPQAPVEGASGATVAGDVAARYGLRPRLYGGVLDGSNEAEQCFLALLPQVTSYLNELAGSSFHLTETEIATTFLAEGGFDVLDGNRRASLSSWGDVGADSLLSNYRALRPWIHPSLRALVESGECQWDQNGQNLRTQGCMSLEQGMYANAGMLAWAKSLAAVEVADIETMPHQAGFFWATLYFNSGPGNARRYLTRNGPGLWMRRWGGAITDVDLGNPMWNATSRMATMDFLGMTALAPDAPRKGSLAACTAQREGESLNGERTTRSSFACGEFDSCQRCNNSSSCDWCPASRTCIQNGGACPSGSEATITDILSCPYEPEPESDSESDSESEPYSESEYQDWQSEDDGSSDTNRCRQGYCCSCDGHDDTDGESCTLDDEDEESCALLDPECWCDVSYECDEYWDGEGWAWCECDLCS